MGGNKYFGTSFILKDNITDFWFYKKTVATPSCPLAQMLWHNVTKILYALI